MAAFGPPSSCNALPGAYHRTVLQGGEIIIILLLALVVLGPQRLPELARKLGSLTRDLRQAARDLRQGLEEEVTDLREVGRDLRAPLDDVRRDIAGVAKETGVDRLEWTGPKPVSGPTPGQAMDDLEKLEREQDEDE